MKVIIISYSFTGNNDALAIRVSAELKAKHIRIQEAKQRKMSTIFFDILFNRTPKIEVMVDKVEEFDLVIFMGPIWLGRAATPLRGYFQQLKNRLGKYAFVSISGGAQGANPNLAFDLKKRIGKDPVVLIDLAIADLLPAVPKPTRQDTMAYHLSESDVNKMTDSIVKTIHETMSK